MKSKASNSPTGEGISVHEFEGRTFDLCSITLRDRSPESCQICSLLTHSIGPLLIQPGTIVWLIQNWSLKTFKDRWAYLILIEEKRRNGR